VLHSPSRDRCMGIITREEMERRLSDPLNLIVLRESLRSGTPVPSGTVNSEIVEHKRSGSGRTPGVLNRTEEDRIAIGELGHAVGYTEAAELSGASVSQVHSYAHGFNSSGHRNPNSELGSAVENSIEAVKERAIAKILECMEVISKEKLDTASPLAVSQIAMNLSKVSPNLENKLPGINTTNQATVVIYSPPVSEESRYKTIKVS
jgi:hypothetical protein